jgi:transcriptional regulator with XRE-family HTH domain
MTHLNTLYESLKARRETLGITQNYLAELSGVALRTLKKIESGKGNPTAETLRKLADVMGMDLKLEIRKPAV